MKEMACPSYDEVLSHFKVVLIPDAVKAETRFDLRPRLLITCTYNPIAARGDAATPIERKFPILSVKGARRCARANCVQSAHRATEV